MNLQKLFDLQRQLDERIEQEHPRQPGEDRLAKKILALLVELGELANEARFFKFWSNDQEPRTEVKIPCRFCGGYGEGYFAGHKWTGQKEKCIVCNGTGIMGLKNPLLEEYVDCLHFLLSIGLEITEPDMIDLKRWNLTKADNITDQFLWLMSDVAELYNGLCNDGFSKFDYEFLLLRFIHLGEMLGFTWEEIEEAYLQKNLENFKRQEDGY